MAAEKYQKLMSAVSRFDGSSFQGSVEAWLARVDATSAALELADLKPAIPLIVGDGVYATLSTNGQLAKSWAEIKTFLIGFYGSAHDQAQARSKLLSLKQGALSVAAFSDLFVQHVSRIDAASTDDWKDQFLAALNPDIYRQLQFHEFATFLAAVKAAKKAESIPTLDSNPAPSTSAPAMAVQEAPRGRGRSFQRGRGTYKPPQSPRFNGECHYCHIYGHKISDCRKRKAASKALALFEDEDAYTTTKTKYSKLPTIITTVNGREVKMHVDSGSTVTCMSLDCANRLGLAVNTKDRLRLHGANAGTLDVVGTSNFSIFLNGDKFDARAQISSNLFANVLLGWDFLQQHRAKICAVDHTIILEDKSYPLICHNHDNKQVLAVEDNQNVTIEHNLSPELDQKLHTLLKDYTNIFAPTAQSYGSAKVEPLKLKIKKGDPIRHRVMPLSPAHEEFRDSQVKEWLATGRIRKSTSSHAARCFPVKKPGGGLRLVIDFRDLNERVEMDNYPPASSQEIFDSLANKPFRSKLDFQASYLQIPVAEQSKKFLSFVTKRGQFEFNYVPFGLNIAGSKLQRELDLLLGDIPGVAGYVDDWVIASETPEEHIQTLRVVFERISKAGLLLKPSKCIILAKELHLLGRVLIGNTIKPDPSNSSDLLSLRPPKNTSELRSFLGSAQWIAPFVQDFASRTACFRPLLKKGSKFRWTELQQEAFLSLKAKLVDPDTLQLPDPSKPFVLETDASTTGLGAVLLQDGKPVAYASRGLTPTEENAGITYLELLAVIWSIDKWHNLLHGAKYPFLLITDHQALLWLRKQSSRTGKLSRWAATLNDYNFTVKHRPGRLHHAADALSRLSGPVIQQFPSTQEDSQLFPVSSEVSIEPQSVLVVDSRLPPTTQQFLEEQAKDQSITSIANKVRNGSEPDFGFDTENVLCSITHNHGIPIFKRLVPLSLRPAVISACHADAGHLGAVETLRRTKSSFSWQGISNDVRKYVQACSACQARKTPDPHRQLPTGTLATEFPGDIVAVDILGGLPPSPEGYNYLLVMIDHFSKYATAAPLKTKTCEEVTTVFNKTWLQHFGQPSRVLTDQGGEFGSRFTTLLRSSGIQKLWTTSYHPQGDSVVERFNRTLADMLAINSRASTSSWPSVLPQVLTSYNSAQSNSTGYSPFFLFFGREPMTSSTLTTSTTPLDTQRRQAEVARTEVAKISQQKRNATTAATPRMTAFEKGELVWVRNPRIRQQPYSKLESPFEGPFRVLFKRSPTNYIVQSLNLLRSGTVHVMHMKKYYSTDQASKNNQPTATNRQILQPESQQPPQQPQQPSQQPQQPPQPPTPQIQSSSAKSTNSSTNFYRNSPHYVPKTPSTNTTNPPAQQRPPQQQPGSPRASLQQLQHQQPPPNLPQPDTTANTSQTSSQVDIQASAQSTQPPRSSPTKATSQRSTNSTSQFQEPTSNDNSSENSSRSLRPRSNLRAPERYGDKQ